MNDFVVFPQEGTEGHMEVDAEPSFLLTSLEVFNWGPFQGKHRCEIDPYGSAIIGPTGSGKTTLVDALMTLLAPLPKYNLASTGGHESDRDLISYIRGVSGTESAKGENDHVARPGRTTTGIAATYIGGGSQVTLGAILWVDGSSNAADDLKKIWFFAKDIEQPLDVLLRLHHEGGKLAITRFVRETVGLRTYTSKKEYSAQLRSFFEVGENAFSLLNRAAGLKQLNSIDQIFRELVLDDRSAFDRALEVATEFDTLQGIYNELQTARRQRDSLLPVAKQQEELVRIRNKLTQRQHLKALLPTWFADVATKLWQGEIEKVGQDLDKIQRQLDAEKNEEARCKVQLDALQQNYLKLGGSAIEGLEETIVTKEKLATGLSRNAGSYQTFVRQIGLEYKLDEMSFQRNKSLLPERKVTILRQYENSRDATLEIATELREQKAKTNDLEIEIREVKARPGSNIPTHFQNFREALAAHLGLAVRELPFMAELVEVKPEEGRWRGAIERAIGSERLRILVPSNHLQEALSWVNQRHNHLHVRLQRAEESPPPARFFDDGFTRKLNFRSHPLRENVKHLLSQRDRHCVESSEILRRTDHGMTAEGTMSDRDGRFEKQDQRPLGDGWMTGFDNTHQLESLAKQLLEIKVAVQNSEAETKKRRDAEDTLRQQLTIIDQLEKLEFHEIDLPRAEYELANLRERLDALTTPDSETSKAKSKYEAVQIERENLQKRIDQLNQTLGGHKTALQTAEDEHRHALDRLGNGLSDEDSVLAAKAFPISDSIIVRNLGDLERDSQKRIDEKIENSEEQQSTAVQRLVRAMESAKREDTGALAEVGTELRDVPDYLARLKILENEALPEKLKRFLDYLNLSSGQGVTQLLTQIDNEVAIIEERVAELNATLSRVDFRQGQFLQLEPAKVVHESLRSLNMAHQKLRVVAMRVEEDQGEAHYRALGELIRIIREAGENRRTLASQALLDPRHRLQFFVVETDRATGRASGRRTGSQTGSGGEKEMMASYILTASLSYALCPVGAARPRYATIVLDEAFSKSSPAAASRIIDALRHFGLHPLFVTPNKEIALLKSHTRSAILVHNKNKRATLTSLTWQQIEAHERIPTDNQ